MSFQDPFFGYSFLIRTIVYVLVPGFAVWQFFRLRRALHVFQLEGYKHERFLRWCADHRRAALFLRRQARKKPLVMTGRAWRILIVATVISVLVVLAGTGIVHVYLGGWPLDIPMWVLLTVVTFVGVPYILVLADRVLAPVQGAINARYVSSARNKLKTIRPVVIGVTGSFGKTSTKFAIAGLIGEPSEVLATPGSYNTPLGVCRAINERLAADHRFLVVEMGAYGEGEIAELCRFVHPTIAVLTAIGPAHLERFGSLEVIRRAKYEIVSSLPPEGTAVMNVDDPEVRAAADATTNVEVIRYGVTPEGRPRVTARDVETTPRGTRLTIVDRRAGASAAGEVRLLGRHSVGHVLAATGVGLALGLAMHDIVARLGRLQPVEHRLQIVDGTPGITVIDDAYNSNPEGAAAALEVLAQMPGATKVVVTPGMIELGSMQFDANAAFAEKVAGVATAMIVVGDTNRDALVAGAERAAAMLDVIEVRTLEEAQGRLSQLLTPGAVVLFENDLPDQYESY